MLNTKNFKKALLLGTALTVLTPIMAQAAPGEWGKAKFGLITRDIKPKDIKTYNDKAGKGALKGASTLEKLIEPLLNKDFLTEENIKLLRDTNNYDKSKVGRAEAEAAAAAAPAVAVDDAAVAPAPLVAAAPAPAVVAAADPVVAAAPAPAVVAAADPVVPAPVLAAADDAAVAPAPVVVADDAAAAPARSRAPSPAPKAEGGDAAAAAKGDGIARGDADARSRSASTSSDTSSMSRAELMEALEAAGDDGADGEAAPAPAVVVADDPEAAAAPDPAVVAPVAPAPAVVAADDAAVAPAPAPAAEFGPVPRPADYVAPAAAPAAAPVVAAAPDPAVVAPVDPAPAVVAAADPVVPAPVLAAADDAAVAPAPVVAAAPAPAVVVAPVVAAAPAPAVVVAADPVVPAPVAADPAAEKAAKKARLLKAFVAKAKVEKAAIDAAAAAAPAPVAADPAAEKAAKKARLLKSFTAKAPLIKAELDLRNAKEALDDANAIMIDIFGSEAEQAAEQADKIAKIEAAEAAKNTAELNLKAVQANAKAKFEGEKSKIKAKIAMVKAKEAAKTLADAKAKEAAEIDAAKAESEKAIAESLAQKKAAFALLQKTKEAAQQKRASAASSEKPEDAPKLSIAESNAEQIDIEFWEAQMDQMLAAANKDPEAAKIVQQKIHDVEQGISNDPDFLKKVHAVEEDEGVADMNLTSEQMDFALMLHLATTTTSDDDRAKILASGAEAAKGTVEAARELSKTPQSLNARITEHKTARLATRMVGSTAQGVAAGDSFKPKLDNVWVKGIVGSAKQGAKDKHAGYKGSNAGFTIGSDFELNESTVVGIAYSNMNSNFKFKQSRSGDKLSGKGQMISLYSIYEFNDRWSVDGIVSAGKTDIKSKRTATGNRIANAKIKNKNFNVEGNVNYKISFDNFVLVPSAGLKYASFKDKAYKEKGAGLYNLDVEGTSNSTVTSVFGIDAMMPYKWSDSTTLIPSLHASIESELKSKKKDLKFAWRNRQHSIKPTSSSSDKVSFNVGGGLTAQHNNIELSADYNCNLQKKYANHQGSLKLKLSF